MTSDVVVALIAAGSGITTSSAIWAFIKSKIDVRSAQDRLLMGLGYDKIVSVGLSYIQRGWVSKDEYEEYFKYLVEPYKEMGGNGVAERIASEVASLPFRTVPFAEILVKGKTNDSQ